MILDITEKLVINPFMREKACLLDYPGHPNGCHNYNKKEGCPPNGPLVNEVFDLNFTHVFIAVSFDLSQFERKMKSKHPEWSRRQCRCVLYWQKKAMANLKREVASFLKEHPGYIANYCPEAFGINVIVTARKVGLPIRSILKDTAYKIALVGVPAKPQNRTIDEFLIGGD